jgi:hypothetical protein
MTKNLKFVDDYNHVIIVDTDYNGNAIYANCHYKSGDVVSLDDDILIDDLIDNDIKFTLTTDSVNKKRPVYNYYSSL